jgi:hypothetical protein
MLIRRAEIGGSGNVQINPDGSIRQATRDYKQGSFTVSFIGDDGNSVNFNVNASPGLIVQLSQNMAAQTADSTATSKTVVSMASVRTQDEQTASQSSSSDDMAKTRSALVDGREIGSYGTNQTHIGTPAGGIDDSNQDQWNTSSGIPSFGSANGMTNIMPFNGFPGSDTRHNNRFDSTS